MFVKRVAALVLNMLHDRKESLKMLQSLNTATEPFLVFSKNSISQQAIDSAYAKSTSFWHGDKRLPRGSNETL